MHAPPPHEHADETPREPLSALLQHLTEGPPGPVRIGDMVEELGRRAFGPLLFVFAIPNLLPLPPGSTTVLGLPLFILAPQLAVGTKPWLPRMIARRSIERASLAQAFGKVLPRLRRIEHLLSPRLGFLFGPVGDRLIGLVCFMLALVLVLPIPLGNLAPAAAIAAFGLGLSQRDGLVVLFGYAVTAVSCGLLALSAGAVLAVLARIAEAVGL